MLCNNNNNYDDSNDNNDYNDNHYTDNISTKTKFTDHSPIL